MDETKLTDAESVTQPDAPAAPEEDKSEKKMREDVAILRKLFPALKPEEIPDEVWDKVREGEGLAASYALYFLIGLKEKERIEEQNRKNEEKAPPRIKSGKTPEEYYTPETVKHMTPAEVRRHYAAILKSMDSWN